MQRGNLSRCIMLDKVLLCVLLLFNGSVLDYSFEASSRRVQMLSAWPGQVRVSCVQRPESASACIVDAYQSSMQMLWRHYMHLGFKDFHASTSTSLDCQQRTSYSSHSNSHQSYLLAQTSDQRCQTWMIKLPREPPNRVLLRRPARARVPVWIPAALRTLDGKATRTSFPPARMA